MKMANISVSTS